jgi:hypothetical protein
LPALSLCPCCRHYPGAATEGTASLIHPVVSAFPERVVGSACASSFSRIAQRSLALRPAHSRCHLFVTRLPEGFSHFVTSMTAPVASGWSIRRVGFTPTGKRRLITAHTLSRRLDVSEAEVYTDPLPLSVTPLSRSAFERIANRQRDARGADRCQWWSLGSLPAVATVAPGGQPTTLQGTIFRTSPAPAVTP